MSVGARAERMLAHRLVELERRLDTDNEEAASSLWVEYYVALDLWLRVRAPLQTNVPMTKAMLEQRFNAPRAGARP